MEQQFAAGLAERQIAEFVDDNDIIAQQRLGEPTAATSRLLLLELVDQIDQVDEPAARTAANDRGCHANADAFAGARAADKVALRLASRNAPVASSRTWPSSIIVSPKTNLSRSFSTRNFGATDAIAD